MHRLSLIASLSLLELFSSNPELDDLMAKLALPNSLVPVTGTTLGTRNSSVLFGRNITRFRIADGRRVPVTIRSDQLPPLAAVIDAFLYLGAYSHEVLPDPDLYLKDPEYLAEVRRRIAILAQVYGGDSWTSELEDLLRCRH